MSLVLGPRANGQSGIFLGKPGVDALHTTDSTQLLFDSTAPGFGSILAVGFAQVSNQSVAVGFPAIGYIPMAYAFLVGDSLACRTRRYWARAGTAQDAANWGMTDSGTFQNASEQLVEPWYHITTNSITFDPSPYTNASGQKAGNYKVRYIVWKLPGSA